MLSNKQKITNNSYCGYFVLGLTRRGPSMLKLKNTKSFRIKRQEEDHGLPGVQRAVPVRAAGVEAGV